MNIGQCLVQYAIPVARKRRRKVRSRMRSEASHVILLYIVYSRRTNSC